MHHNAWRTMLKSARWFLFIQTRVDKLANALSVMPGGILFSEADYFLAGCTLRNCRIFLFIERLQDSNMQVSLRVGYFNFGLAQGPKHSQANLAL